ncbi:hypothetical protein [Flavobacterium daemonense]|uniref:hypothetical protein n=1 Tax=Flavobacterium daemonense TaxID=1393049 RepID=UPI001B85EE25|nr:hypothetical protein [Flavobacterium daemonense]
MYDHTLILTTTKTATNDLSLDFVTHLINTGDAMVEYFGVEIDNQADFIDDDMREVSREITYIEIFFDTPDPIDYDAMTEIEIDDFILKLLANSTIYDMTTDGKDVILNLEHHPN